MTDDYIEGEPRYMRIKPRETPPKNGDDPHRRPGPGDKPEMPTWARSLLCAAGLVATLAVLNEASALYIAGAIGFIASMVLLDRQIWRSRPAWWAILAVAGSTLVPAGAAYLLESDSTEEVHGPTVSITTPEEGAVVPYRARVEGTSEDIPLESRPWLFVYSHDGNYYPQGGDEGEGLEIDPHDGSWCRIVWFGDASLRPEDDNGYSLILALPTPKADQTLEHHMNSQLPGRVVELKSLPEEFEKLSVRYVKRPRVEINATPSCR